MLKASLKHIQTKLNISLATVGDMALKRRARRIIEELELRKDDCILDIGCGNGYYLSLLNRLGFNCKLFGVDNDKRALLDAKINIDNNKVKLIFKNAERLPFRNKIFDKIIISEVIEHITDEKKVLSEAYRILKPGGVFVLTTCNIDYPFFWDPINWVLQHLFNTHIKAGFWAGIWNQHLRLYKKGRIERLVKEAGFNLEISEPLTYWCLPFNHYIVNFIARLLSAGRLPQGVSRGFNKFKNSKQPFLIKIGYKMVNLIDKLNDLFPKENGVSVFIKARK